MPLDETSSIILKDTERNIRIPLGMFEAVTCVINQLTYGRFVRKIILPTVTVFMEIRSYNLDTKTFLHQLHPIVIPSRSALNYTQNKYM